jgi:hypothetical protein
VLVLDRNRFRLRPRAGVPNASFVRSNVRQMPAVVPERPVSNTLSKVM